MPSLRDQPNGDAWDRLRRTVRLEVLGLVAAIVVTGFLVNIVPARSAATEPAAAGEAGPFEFVLSGFASAPQVWDVTEPQAIRRLGVRADGGAYRVQVEGDDPDRPRELVAFTTDGAAVRPLGTGAPVPNQNLHAVAGFPDYVIVVAAAFREAADELAAYRAADGLTPLVVNVEAIYNEFSGGLMDMRAVRDYLRFLYDRGPDTDPALRYALLFGDAAESSAIRRSIRRSSSARNG